MSGSAEWSIRSRQEWPSGTYYELNVRTSGREGSGTVTVKARSRPGPPYVCLTCKLNDCEHTRFVAERDEADADSDGRPRNHPAAANT